MSTDWPMMSSTLQGNSRSILRNVVSDAGFMYWMRISASQNIVLVGEFSTMALTRSDSASS